MSETVQRETVTVDPALVVTRTDPPSPVGVPGRDRDTLADRFMRRLLRLPLDGPKASAADARRAFRTSLLVTTVRCLLMYIVLPFVLPAVGLATDAAPAIVLPINVVAMVMIVISVRRFWRADHPKRWWYTALGGTVFAFLTAMIISDVMQLA